MKFEIAGGAMIIDAPEDPERYVMDQRRTIARPQPTIEFDGVTRNVVDFVYHVRGLEKDVRRLKEAVARMDKELEEKDATEEDLRSLLRLDGRTQMRIDRDAAVSELEAERRRNAELKNQLEYEVGRTGERVREVRELQEALRQKNEIIKSIREKVAEARIYE
jgi:paraquat-inducible protein B